jgi:hypothetical protein
LENQRYFVSLPGYVPKKKIKKSAVERYCAGVRGTMPECKADDEADDNSDHKDNPELDEFLCIHTICSSETGINIVDSGKILKKSEEIRLILSIDSKFFPVSFSGSVPGEFADFQCIQVNFSMINPLQTSFL